MSISSTDYIRIFVHLIRHISSSSHPISLAHPLPYAFTFTPVFCVATASLYALSSFRVWQTVGTAQPLLLVAAYVIERFVGAYLLRSLAESSFCSALQPDAKMDRVMAYLFLEKVVDEGVATGLGAAAALLGARVGVEARGGMFDFSTLFFLAGLIYFYVIHSRYPLFQPYAEKVEQALGSALAKATPLSHERKIYPLLFKACHGKINDPFYTTFVSQILRAWPEKEIARHFETVERLCEAEGKKKRLFQELSPAFWRYLAQEKLPFKRREEVITMQLNYLEKNLEEQLKKGKEAYFAEFKNVKIKLESMDGLIDRSMRVQRGIHLKKLDVHMDKMRRGVSLSLRKEREMQQRQRS